MHSFQPLIMIALLLLQSPAFALTVTVTDSGDTEGSCSTSGAGACTLRDAINFANSNAGSDTIVFAIPGAAGAVRTILLNTQLPPITESVSIDGFSQTGAVPNSNGTDQGLNARLLISVDGVSHLPPSSAVWECFDIGNQVANVTIQGLVINCRFTAIRARNSRGNVIQGNYIGTDPSGTSVLESSLTSGVELRNDADSRIGGLLPAQRNLIAGPDSSDGILAVSSSNLVVQGNLIGTDASGTQVVGTGGVRLNEVTGVVIGGASVAARNVISGSSLYPLSLIQTRAGVVLDPNNALIQNNYIGVDISGGIALGNGAGVLLLQPRTNITFVDNVVAASEREGVIVQYGDVRVANNRIGIGVGGQPLGNGGSGVHVTGRNDTTFLSHVIENNIIAYNGGGQSNIISNGILITGIGIGTAILGNSIFANTSLSPMGTALGISRISNMVTPNDELDADIGLQNYPLLDQATISGDTALIRGRLHSTPSQVYRLEFFANRACDPSGYGEGRFYLGSTQATTDAAGNATFSSLRFTLPEPGARTLTATATNATNTTSEFSRCAPSRSTPPISPQPTTELQGDQPQSRLGFSAAAAGDINNDGFSDLVAGAPDYSNDQSNEGRVRVYLGSASGVSESAAQQLELDQDSAQFGYTLAGVGDVNNDGFSDVAVGMPGFGIGQARAGALLLYLGSASGLSASPIRTIEGGQMGAQLGFSVVGIGDINNDGYDDLAAGLPFYRAGGGEVGAVGLLFGAETANLPTTLDPLLLGEQSGSEFGAALSGIDFNGDGHGDLLVGAPGYDVGVAQRAARRGLLTDAGAVYFYAGTGSTVNPTPVAVARGGSANDRLGSGLAGFDVTGDGFGDAIVGVPGYSNEQVNEGAVQIYAGGQTPSSTPLQTLESDHSGAMLGTSISGVGDINSDAIPELLAGAPGYSNGQSNEGAGFFYLSSGQPTTPYVQQPTIILEGEQAGARAGQSVSSLGSDDTGANSPLELVLGAPGYNGMQGEDVGQVRLYALLGALFANSFEP